MFAKFVLLFVATLAIGGCASDRGKPTQDDLQPPTVANSILVKEELAINRFKSGQNGLSPGVYVPVAESKEGIFYDGPKDCIWEDLDNKRTTYEGGIWWPKTKESKPRMYWRLSEKQLPKPGPDGRLVGGYITYWIIHSGLGHANFFPEISNEKLVETLAPIGTLVTQ